MNLSTNSWHSWIYRMTYGFNRLPKNLCPYFWRLLLTPILFPIGFLVTLPYYTACKIGDGKYFTEYEDGFFGSRDINFVKGIFTNAVLFVVFCMIFMWFQPLTGQPTFIQIIGVTFWFLIIISFMGWAITSLVKKFISKKSSTQKEKTPNILVESIKSWYNKNCPIINWK